MKSHEVYFPSLGEQRRIAAILDKADALRRRRKRALESLDDLTEAIFLDMFGDPIANPKGWPSKTLGGFEKFLTSGSRGWAKHYSKSGRAFIRIQNLVGGRLSLEELVYVDAPNNAEARRTTVQAGDVLISITADLGRTAVVPDSLHQKAHINQHIALFRAIGIDPFYLAMYLASSAGKRQFETLNRQGVKAGLNFDNIRSLMILEPPLEMQREYVARIEKLDALRRAGRLQARTLEAVFSSLQERAFSAQL